MLQNQCKGIIFYINNQKKTHKILHRYSVFLIYINYVVRELQRSTVCLVSKYYCHNQPSNNCLIFDTEEST